MYVTGGPAKETRTEPLELVDGVGGEAMDLGWLTGIITELSLSSAVDQANSRIRCGLGRVDDGDASRGGALDERAQQRVMGAAEDKGIGAHAISGGSAGEFAKVDADYGVSDMVVDPAFFDQRDEQRASFLVGA